MFNYNEMDEGDDGVGPVLMIVVMEEVVMTIMMNDDNEDYEDEESNSPSAILKNLPRAFSLTST